MERDNDDSMKDSLTGVRLWIVTGSSLFTEFAFGGKGRIIAGRRSRRIYRDSEIIFSHQFDKTLTGKLIFDESIGRITVAGWFKRGLFGVGYCMGLIRKIGCACGALRLTKVVGLLVCAVFLFLMKIHIQYFFSPTVHNMKTSKLFV